MVVRPRCSATLSPRTLVPTLAPAMNLVLESVVVVLVPGKLSVGFQNVLNKDYYPVISQTTAVGRDEAYAKAPGAMMLVKYGVDF